MKFDNVARIHDLGTTIVNAAAQGIDETTDAGALQVGDIREAALAVLYLIDPDFDAGTVRLRVRFAPSVGNSDTVELPDGRLVDGVQAVTVEDHVNEPRVATIKVRGIAVLGQPELP